MKTDIGCGIEVELKYVEGALDGVTYWHEPCGKDYLAVQPAWKTGWQVQSLDPLTLAPSVLCRKCGLHGFIQNGKWVSA